MAAGQIAARGIKDPRVIEAMAKVPRHLFIPEPGRGDAYADGPVAIGYGQTISQPYVVALMTEALEPKPGDKVLEIGTGSGYQSAVLEELGAQIYTVEIVPELAQTARENLRRAGYPGARVKTGDGAEGWKEFAPFGAVIVTCAPENVPPALMEQLKDGGRIVIPVGPADKVQELVLLTKSGEDFTRIALAPVRFVPMVGE